MFFPSSHMHYLILLYLTVPFLLFHIHMFFDLLSTRLSTLEAQKRLHDKQPEAELKKGCAYKKKTCSLSLREGGLSFRDPWQGRK